MPCATALAICMSLWFTDHGYLPYQRDAMIRQAWIESRHQPCVVSRAGSVFLFQWNGARRKALLKASGGRCPSWDQQLAFADAELRSGAYEAFWRASPATAFMVLRETFGYGRSAHRRELHAAAAAIGGTGMPSCSRRIGPALDDAQSCCWPICQNG